MNFYTRKNIHANAVNPQNNIVFDENVLEEANDQNEESYNYQSNGQQNCFCRPPYNSPQPCNPPQCWQNTNRCNPCTNPQCLQMQIKCVPCGQPQCGSPQWGQPCCPSGQCCPPQCCHCPPGPRGPRGPRGFRGQKGPKGDGSDGAIIPFASGNTPVALTTVLNDTAELTSGYVSAIGFGETQNGITIGVGGELSLSAGNLAFSVPRNATITAITAYFTNTPQISINSSVLQISTQLYYSATPNNVFIPLPGSRVNLTPTLTGIVPPGSVFVGSTNNLNIGVLQGTRLLFIFFARVISGAGIATTIGGNASAGVNVI